MVQVFPVTPPPNYSAHHRRYDPATTLHSHNSESFYNTNFSKKATVLLSYIQLSLSLALIISEIIKIKYPFDWYVYGSPGMICGIIFVISGSFGIRAVTHSSRCTIVAHMVFAIISAFICIPLIFYSIVIVNHITTKNKSSVESTRYTYKYSNLVKVTTGIFIAQGIIGLIQAGIAIASSAMACSVICCRDKPPLVTNQISTEPPTKHGVLSGPVIWISTIQIIACILAIILNVVGIFYPYGDEYAHIGTGIWTAIPFMLCGIFGILSKMKSSKCLIITYMIFAIISTFFFVPYFGISLVGMATSSNGKESSPSIPEPISKVQCGGFGGISKRSEGCKWEWNDKYKGSWKEVYNNEEKQRYDEWKKKDTRRKVTFGVFLLHTLMSLGHILISANSAAMSCQSICCSSDTEKAQQPIQEIIPTYQVQIQNAAFKPREMPISYISSQKTFQEIIPTNQVQIQNIAFNQREIPVSPISSQKPFTYQPPQELVYLSSTHAEINRGMKIQSTANCPDIY